MTLRVDQAWRGRLLRALSPRPKESLLDLCAGTMDVARLAVRRTPGLKVVAADFSLGMLRLGVSKTGLPGSDPGRRHGPALPACRLRPRHRHLRPAEPGRLRGGPPGARAGAQAGRAAGVPSSSSAPTARPGLVHQAYNRLALPVLGRLLLPDPAAYRYLVQSMERFASRPEFEAAAARAGFSEVRGETLFPGVCGLVTAVRA